MRVRLLPLETDVSVSWSERQGLHLSQCCNFHDLEIVVLGLLVQVPPTAAPVCCSLCLFPANDTQIQSELEH